MKTEKPEFRLPPSLRTALDAVRAICPPGFAEENDPVRYLHRYRNPADVEVVGWLSASLAYGRRELFLRVLERLFAALPAHPADYFGQRFPARGGDPLPDLQYRFNTGADLGLAGRVLGEVVRERGSLAAHFSNFDDPASADLAEAVRGALRSFRRRLGRLLEECGAETATGGEKVGNPWFLFPDPDGSSALKRAFMFLRWMVRREPPDRGLWPAFDPGRLVIPLDAHVFRLGRRLGLIRQTSASLAAAREMTSALRTLCPNDPLRWDFSLSWWGAARCGGGEAPCAAAAWKACPLSSLCSGRRR